MSRNGSIELSPKYGVNPTIPVCFWCGKEKNEIALMGRVRKRERAGIQLMAQEVHVSWTMMLKCL